MNRTNLRTFKWRITGGSGAGIFGFEPSTGELRVANPQRLDENTTYSLKVRVSDGFHESTETDVTVVVGELSNVVDGDAGATVPATLALTLGSATFGAFTPGIAKDYETTAAANVISTAGDATLSVVDPGPPRPAGWSTARSRSPSPSRPRSAARSRRSAPCR